MKPCSGVKIPLTAYGVITIVPILFVLHLANGVNEILGEEGKKVDA